MDGVQCLMDFLSIRLLWAY